MEILPVELLENIFHQLSSLKDFQNAFNTCYKWRKIIENLFKNKGKINWRIKKSFPETKYFNFTYKTTFSGKILIASRYPSDDLEIEIIDLINPRLNFKFTVDGRASIKGAVGGFVQNKPVICGGVNDRGNIQNCLVLGENSTFSMITNRFYASSVLLKQQQQLWVTGGQTVKKDSLNATTLNSTEFVKLDQPNSVQGPDLPFTILGHTMVQINPKSILIIGGYQNGDISNKTWFVDLSNGFEIKEGPPLQHARVGHSCSKIIIKGKVFIVVAGGIQIPPSSIQIHAVEILDSTSPKNAWTFGMHLFN